MAARRPGKVLVDSGWWGADEREARSLLRVVEESSFVIVAKDLSVACHLSCQNRLRGERIMRLNYKLRFFCPADFCCWACLTLWNSQIFGLILFLCLVCTIDTLDMYQVLTRYSAKYISRDDFGTG